MLSRFWKQVNGYIFGFRSGTRYSLSHNKIQLYHISSLLLNSGPLSNMISPPPNKNIHCFLCGYGYETAPFPGPTFRGGTWVPSSGPRTAMHPGKKKNCRSVGWWAECMDDLPWKGEQWPPRGKWLGKHSLHGVSGYRSDRLMVHKDGVLRWEDRAPGWT